MKSYPPNQPEEGIINAIAKSIRRRRCALLIGLGLALTADVEKELPSSHLQELLRRMVQWCIENTAFEKEGIANDVMKMLEAGDLDKVELKLQEHLSTEKRRQCISEILLQNQAEVHYIYHLLAKIDFRAYLTTGFDEFLEIEYKDINKSLPLSKYYKNSIDEALEAYQMEEPFILKLHGDVAESSPDILTLSNRFAKSRLPEAIDYPKQIRELLTDLHTVFVGFETSDLDLEGLKSVVNKTDELHRWLLIPQSHFREQVAEQLWQNDKIITLHYENRTQLTLFLRKLEEVSTTLQLLEVYLSYVPEDTKFRNQLYKHLSIMEYPGLKITWSDGKIRPGQERKGGIEERLKSAQVILLFVSVDYLASIHKSTIKTEMIRAVQRDRREEARIIPIIVRSCEWKPAPFGRLAALPSDEIPLDLAPNLDLALLEAAREIKTAIEEWVEKH
jgi:hypothetical protein